MYTTATYMYMYSCRYMYMYVYIEYLYSFQDGWVEDVHSSVDFVGDKHLWLLHETLDLTCAFIVDDHSILGGLLDLCYLQQRQCDSDRKPLHCPKFHSSNIVTQLLPHPKRSLDMPSVHEF